MKMMLVLDRHHPIDGAVRHSVPLITTISAVRAAVNAIEAMLKGENRVKTIQEYHREIKSYQS
jgi:carbamoyl-phosphate synthase large subunit